MKKRTDDCEKGKGKNYEKKGAKGSERRKKKDSTFKRGRTKRGEIS